MDKEKYLFVVNPVAGKNRGISMIPVIESICREKGVSYHIAQTEKKGGAKAVVEAHLEQGFTTVIAVGGDGTVNEVVNGIGNEPLKIGILPCGTGNDFARALNMPKTPEEALQNLLAGAASWVDKGKAGEHYFLNIASIGLDAEIAAYTNKIKKKIKGPSAYVLALLKTLITFRPIKVSFQLDNLFFEREIMLAAVCNGNYYGGGMKIAPQASCTDGWIDLCVIEKMPKLRLLYLFPKVFKGKHVAEKEVKIYRVKTALLSGNLQGMVNIDGEIIKLAQETKTGYSQVQFRLEPGSLQFIGGTTAE